MSSDNAEPATDSGWQVVPTRRRRKAAPEIQAHENPGQAPTALTSDTISPADVAATESTGPKAEVESSLPSFPRAHRYDRIYTAARNKIINYNRQSLAHFTNPLQVEATTRAATEYQRGESNEATLALVRHKKVEHIQCKLVRGRGPKARIDVLMCLNGEDWVSLDSYLSALKTPKGQIRRGQKGIEQQQACWSKNGKSFNFLGLPAELRDGVYENLIPQDVYPVTYAHGIVPFGHGSERLLQCPQQRYRKHDPTHKIVPQPDIAVVGTCRQLKSEVDRFLEIETSKCFTEPSNLNQFIHKLGDPDKFNNFSHVELDFSHRDYMHFFKVEVPPFPQMSDKFGKVGAPDLAATLRDLPHIKSITLRFTSPFDAMMYDPFGYTGEYRNDLDWYHDWHGNREQDGFATSCQKTIVDWILTFAKEYVQHIPEIKLAGAIKNSTKMKWDLIFKEEKN
ncbi:hypothetical protein M409DRAFT_15640 [Zasmidium cellare ATCC 36951]|uniref:Uncharacterized protein n=1 Tax=Zasmidium cellare ATCC 36951 TaxID=1080233 RepID=A0A6A6D2E3_ZASCE|nr:uncharacterized protein M409DRAFT_15640 [Zasmidium cellare ATCC 36951]KAF2173355.1 hypothetical protein M409DRAFT_15640 [Zasmidium cellare ATCC 36951]